VRPISGFTGLTLTRTGKNLLGAETLYAEKTLYSVSGVPSSNNNYNTYRIKAVANCAMVFSATPADGNMLIRALQFTSGMVFDKALISSGSGTADVRYQNTIRPDADGFVLVCVRKSATDSMIEFSSYPSDYIQHQGNTYPISWQTEAGTVYGGTLDVVSGLLTVTHTTITLNGSETWGATNNSAFYVQVNNAEKLSDYVGAIICDKLKTYAAHSSQAFIDAENGITGYYDYTNAYPSQNWIYAKADGITTAADFKTWLASNPLQIVYELATPLEISLTPTEADSLLGENNLWHDANGNTTVVYRADTALYIAKKIAEAVA
jgi:hypothetical protein